MGFGLKHTDGTTHVYQEMLGQMDNGKFRWQLMLDYIEGVPGSHNATPGWRRVGPEFATRDKGASFLGWRDGQVDHHTKVPVGEHMQQLADEYNAIISKENGVHNGTLL